MSDPRPEELIHAEKLSYIGKVEESLEIIRNYERTREISPEERLWALLLRGWVNVLKRQLNDVIEVGKRTYMMSQELGLVPEAIEALILKGHCLFLGKTEEALNNVLEAEKLIKTLPDTPSYNYSKIVVRNLLLKSWVYYYNSDYNTAFNLAEDSLALAEKTESKVQIGLCLELICNIYLGKGEPDKAREYAMKTLDFWRNLNIQIGIANGLQILGQSYFFMGNISKALKFIQESLSVETIPEWTKIRSLYVLGEIYRTKGLLDIALENYEQGFKLAMELSSYVFIGAGLIGIGSIYRQKGDLDQAKKYLEQGLTHFKEKGWFIGAITPVLYLLLISLDENSQEQANHYLSWLKKYAGQIESKFWFQQGYKLGKSFMLRSTSRMRDNAKAEGLLKQILDEDIVNPEYHILALITLCDLYLEELSIYNNQEVIKEINPLLEQLLDMAGTQHSFSWLAEGRLLLAKLTLIRMDLDEAKILLTQAQQIAEEHGLNLLAQKISSEHDLLLEKVDEWDRLKNEGAPMADRIELASFDGVINRLQRKKAVDPPELVEEEPILLLIMDNNGSTYFNHPFIANWDHSDLFSSFMSAFNTFSDEIFSKSIDRIRIGENTILINPVEPFLACYVIKGQSYPALRKLNLFTEAIRENSEIWQALNKSTKTSEMLELDKPPVLKTVITEIFTQ